MPNVFTKHLPDCTPLHQCRNCVITRFLQERAHLNEKTIAEFFAVLEGEKSSVQTPRRRVQPKPSSTRRPRRARRGKAFEDGAPIEVLKLPTKASNLLKAAGIPTIGILCDKNEQDLKNIKGFGRRFITTTKNGLRNGNRRLVRKPSKPRRGKRKRG